MSPALVLDKIRAAHAREGRPISLDEALPNLGVFTRDVAYWLAADLTLDGYLDEHYRGGVPTYEPGPRDGVPA